MTRIGRSSALLVAVAVVVIAVIGGGLWLIGSPTEQRLLKLDERRVDDLHSIANRIDVYWNRHQGLPKSLDALEGQPGWDSIPLDRERNEPYSYRVLEQRSYELCARFDRKSRYARARQWAHEAGPYCYRFEMKDAGGSVLPVYGGTQSPKAESD
ncbi:MAG: hypothetical protein JRE81_06005 [Deltaproteobacteria bacterium]|jgi:hypothetical protein|nr:hypothetical protein [Deltaproteobacteria bacterium]